VLALLASACTCLPSVDLQVLVVNCAVAEASDVSWWQPEQQTVTDAEGYTHQVGIDSLIDVVID
jgi:hypothetical protein